MIKSEIKICTLKSTSPLFLLQVGLLLCVSGSLALPQGNYGAPKCEKKKVAQPISYDCTGKSLSEALIFASTNPTIWRQIVHWITSSVHENSKLIKCCVHKLFWMSKQKQKTICVHNMFSTCSELGIFIYWSRNSMNNLLSYYGLVDEFLYSLLVLN